MGGLVIHAHMCLPVPPSDRARGEGHMINCLPPGPSEHRHHDVGRNGNCSLSPSLHQFRTRVGLTRAPSGVCCVLTNRCARDKGRHV